MYTMYGNARNNKGKLEFNNKVKPGKCIFPFMYKWKNHKKCYTTPKGNICATSISLPRRTLKTYGYCVKKRTKKKTLKKRKRKTAKKFKKRIRIPKKIDLKNTLKKRTIESDMTLNTQFVKLLEDLESLMQKKGEYFRARAYAKAKERIILYKEPITKVSQLKGQRDIGETIRKKLNEYVKTGTLKVLENAKNDPVLIFTNIYGVGPKKAQQLVKKHNITTIKQLIASQEEVLNDVQKKGLKYYNDILLRIPRSEIDLYRKELQKIFDSVKNSNSIIEIMGSYRRGAKNSGDIDIIISDPDDEELVFTNFIDNLIKNKILIEVLSRGKVKSLGVSKLRRKPARRIDFMFTPKKELAFALLYFTGSKAFNTVMRQRALDLGYSMNEHGFHKMVNGKKTTKLDRYFPTEKSIFDFLGMVYKKPTERIDGNAVQLVSDLPKPKKKTKKRKSKSKKIISGKKLIKMFLKNGQSFLENTSENELSSMIRTANQGYYCNDKSLMTDEEYDILKEFIEDKFPDNVAITEGHTACSIVIEKNVKLPFEMWSMNKFKTENQITIWLKKYKGPYITSAKVDGISAGYSTMGGKQSLFTRGNGRIGKNITPAIQFLNLPTKKDIEIRGELLMKKDIFQKKWSEQFANVRSMISGAVIALQSGNIMHERWVDIDFVAYEVVSPQLIPSKQFKFLEKHNVVTVINKKYKRVNKTTLSKDLLNWRENYDYDIDGIIVADNKMYPRTSKNPKHAFAFKMVLDDQIVESKVVDVIWSPSKDGYLKPKIQIQPVEIGGAVIQFATVHNAEFVIKNKIGLGAVIQIIRSGDVIPKVEKVVKPAKTVKMPSSSLKYKWNKTHKDFVLEDPEDNKIVILKTLEAFFVKLDVAGLGRGNIKRFMDAGFDSIPKIINMSIQDIINIDGFKEKMATKVYNSIHERLDKVKLHVLMGASNIFGRGLGSRRIVKILDAYPDIITSKVSNQTKIEMIAKLEGFKERTAEMFVPYIPEFVKFIKSINLSDKLTIDSNKENVDKSHPLYGKKIILTGVRDKELQSKIEEVGGKLSSSVSKNTFIVIVKSLDDDTGKADKAREIGIPLITIEKFKQEYFI